MSMGKSTRREIPRYLRGGVLLVERVFELAVGMTLEPSPAVIDVNGHLRVGQKRRGFGPARDQVAVRRVDLNGCERPDGGMAG